MSDDLQFTCQVCGKQFEPTPDAMVEWEVEPKSVPTNKVKDLDMTREDLAELEPDELKEMGLTEETRSALLEGKAVKFGGCICIQCQDEMLEEQQP